MTRKISDTTANGFALSDPGDDVIQHIGALEEATKNLKEQVGAEDLDPEQVGKWITVIGKAIMAVFKI